MAGTGTKRIIELTEASAVQNGDYIAVDSNARGTKKVSTDTLATAAALTAETNARAGADEQMSERMDGIEEQTALIQNPTKTISGALVSFTDGAPMPMVACTAEIVPKQSGSGTPSPDNVRAISGWESVNVNVSGKNLCEIYKISPTNSAITLNEDKTSITVNGTLSSNVTTALYVGEATELQKALPSGVTYVQSNDLNARMLLLKKSGGQSRWISGGASFTLTENEIQGYWYVQIPAGTYNNEVYHFQIELGTTATTYEPYTGTTTTVNLGRTVYGGTLDVVTGVLTVDRVMVDLGTLDWAYAPNVSMFNVTAPSDSPAINDPKNLEAFCEWYDNQTGIVITSMTDGSFCMNTTRFSGSRKVIAIKDSRYTDPTAFKTAVSGVKLVYELATPTTYQLTPTEVNTLLGENNVWADSGDVEITYRRDISIVINNLETALNG